MADRGFILPGVGLVGICVDAGGCWWEGAAAAGCGLF